MSFARRRIELKFTLGTGSFGDGNSVTLSGLRCSANITKAGGAALSSLDLTVYGMTLDQMNKLTVLNVLQYTEGAPNTVTVSAGDDQQLSVCFQGNITEAWADANGAPDVKFHVAAYNGVLDATKPADVTSYKGEVDVATILSAIAGQMDPPRTFENSGVSVQLRDPYLPGTLLDQAKAAATAANIYMLLDDDVLAIWPKDGTRNLDVATISPETGLVGYPAFSQNNINLRTLYNPNVAIGGKVKVKSSLEQANGSFVVAKVTHNLDAETPGGAWFTALECGLPGQDAPVATGAP